MDERKFGRILETGMGLIMSGVLNFSAMKILGAPVTFMSVMIGWVGAFAAAVAINYFFPVMDWCIGWTKGITNKTAEYIVRVFIFAFIEILFKTEPQHFSQADGHVGMVSLLYSSACQ